MRRVLVVLSSFVLLSAGLVPAASADSTIVVRDLTPPDESPYNLTLFRCDVGLAIGGLPDYFHVESTTPPPELGQRSWGYDIQNAGRFRGISATTTTSAELDTFQMRVYSAAGGSSTGRAMILAEPPGTPEGQIWLGTTNVSHGASAWTTVDAANATYAWGLYDTAGWFPTGPTAPNSTLDAFVTLKGESTTGYFAFMGFGCDGQDFWYDAFKWGSAGNVTTLDFEALATSVTISATKTTIVGGTSTTIKGTPSTRYSGGTPADLEVKKFGESSFIKVATVVSSEDPWTLSKSVKPLKQATYRWHFLETEADQESFSEELIVNVKTGLTATIADRTLNRGQNLVVTGKTTPKKPGATLTLWRKTSTGAAVLATTTVKSDGSYRVVAPVNQRGTWKVYTTVPAGSGNLAGKSPIREAQVS